jgi:transposase-like protein
MDNTTNTNRTRTGSTRKVIASGLAGLALVGAIAVGGSAIAGAATTATAAVTQGVTPHGVRGWIKEHRKEMRAEGAKTVSTTIGISTDELKQDLKNGQSIAEIATAHNVDPQTVATALVNQVDARIDKAVADGQLTQTRADTLKGRVPTVVNRIINHHKGDAKPAKAGH